MYEFLIIFSSDVESLRKGIIKTSKNGANRPYTILLVGETGVGKSSVLEFIANVLTGNDTDHYNFDFLDRTNEQGGSNNQSQTNAPHLYEFKSKNGTMVSPGAFECGRHGDLPLPKVNILDTPGLADNCSIQQDELHKRNIATQNKQHIDSIIAVLVLVNGAVPRVAAGTDNTLSTLSAIFPKSLASNTAIMFTNVLSPPHWNLSGDTIPNSLKNAPCFLLNNPVALQKKYLKRKDDPNMKTARADLRKAVKASEETAMGMLVELFDWLDGLEAHEVVAGPAETIEGEEGIRKVKQGVFFSVRRRRGHSLHLLRLCVSVLGTWVKLFRPCPPMSLVLVFVCLGLVCVSYFL